ncbi:MAG TPA: hypothetical protein VK686_24795, partial [Bryobacteraceae bacterium]|nr:hypothetical protein [Bryobacteraceae bacterium]
GYPQYYRNQTFSFYDNTYVYVANTPDVWKSAIFQPELSTAVVDVRNNIFLFLPRTSGGGIPEIDWSGNNNGPPTGAFQFGVNWVSPGSNMAFTAGTAFTGTSSGASNLISPSNNKSPLNYPTAGDFTLPAGSVAIGAAGALGAVVTSNPEGGNYTPTQQYKFDEQTVPRTSLADLGALAHAGQAPVLPCDLNGDGVVNNLDVQIAIAQALGTSACGNAALQQNGVCNVIDVQRVINAANGQVCRVGP